MRGSRGKNQTFKFTYCHTCSTSKQNYPSGTPWKVAREAAIGDLHSINIAIVENFFTNEPIGIGHNLFMKTRNNQRVGPRFDDELWYFSLQKVNV